MSTLPIFENAIKNTSFFNGRLLSAEDLKREQTADVERARRLGMALGHGVAWGLEVEKIDDKTVSIKAGLAVNRNGDTVAIGEPKSLPLVASNADDSTGTGSYSPFQSCGQTGLGSYVSGRGLYLVTISPAVETKGLAPVNWPSGTPASCNSNYTQETARLRLVWLNPTVTDLDITNIDAASEKTLQNRLAYKCFGYDAVASFISNPFTADASAQPYGLVDALVEKNIFDESEIPLAIIYYDATLTVGNKVVFIDRWCVRRRITAPGAAGAWDMMTGDRKMAEAEAMVMQFQEQIGSQLSGKVTVSFDTLPPVGILPINYATAKERFAGLAYSKQIFVDFLAVPALVKDALSFPPIDTSKTEETIWLYSPIKGNSVLNYTLFANGLVPCRNDARFNLARFDRAYYAPA